MNPLTHDEAWRAAGLAAGWWRALTDPDDRDRATLAELRRCKQPTEVAFVPAFHALLRRLKNALPERGIERLFEPAAVAAMVLARVREEGAQHPARQLGPAEPGKADSRALMSELRFRALLQARNGEELARLLGRSVRLLDGTADPRRLAYAAFAWSDRTRRDWAFEYYGAAWSLRRPEGDRPAVTAVPAESA